VYTLMRSPGSAASSSASKTQVKISSDRVAQAFPADAVVRHIVPTPGPGSCQDLCALGKTSGGI
jgi:hypothetical protein